MNNKCLLSKKEELVFKEASKNSLRKQLSYFNQLKDEGLIKSWLSLHQFKRLGLYDSLINHRSSYPNTFVQGNNGFKLFNINSDMTLRVMDWKDKKTLKAYLVSAELKASSSYEVAVKNEQVRLLSKVKTQLGKGNFVSLKMVNNGSFSNRELTAYVFGGVIKKFKPYVLKVLKCYKYYLEPSYKDFLEGQVSVGHIHLRTGQKESLRLSELQAY